MTFDTNRRAILAAAIAGAVMASQAASPACLTFAVVPQLPPEDTYEAWMPVVRRLQAQSGLCLRLQTYSSMPEFEKAFLQGAPDIAFLNPYHAVMARKARGYTPIVRDNTSPLTGILVVRHDSPLRSVNELAGATLAFPAPNAFAASLYMRGLLSRKHGLEFKSEYVRTHSNVLRQVITGQAAAGGVVRSTLNSEDPAIRQQVRILFETPPSPPHPVVVHPRISAPVRLALQQALLSLAKQSDGPQLLAPIHMTKPVEARSEDYAPLERLDLEKFLILPPP